MSERNAVQRGFDRFGKEAGAEKKSGGWYWRSDEVVAVVDLQKSQYGRQYYVNVAFWLLALGDERFPKTWKSHIQVRLGSLPGVEREDAERLLDLDRDVPEKQRVNELCALLDTSVTPVIRPGSSLDGLRSMIDDGTLKARRSAARPRRSSASSPASCVPPKGLTWSGVTRLSGDKGGPPPPFVKSARCSKALTTFWRTRACSRGRPPPRSNRLSDALPAGASSRSAAACMQAEGGYFVSTTMATIRPGASSVGIPAAGTMARIPIGVFECALWSVRRDPVNAPLNHTGTQQQLLEQLIVTISRLARPAESQIAYLETLGPGTTADELALELDDVAEAAVAIRGLLSQRQRDLVRALDERLREMSGPNREELWSQQALRTSPTWAQVRADARAALADLHVERAVAN